MTTPINSRKCESALKHIQDVVRSILETTSWQDAVRSISWPHTIYLGELEEQQELRSAYDDAVTQYNHAVTIAKSLAAKYQIKKSAFERKNESFKATGQINLSRLANYKTSDEIFHNKLNVRQASNHGLVVILDISKSMRSKIKFLAMQFLITALYSKYAKINSEIYAFTSKDKAIEIMPLVDRSTSIAKIRELFFSMHISNITENSYKMHLLRCHSSADELQILGTHRKIQNVSLFAGRMGSTPLTQAKIFAYHRAMHMKSLGIENVSVTFVTDGDATDSHAAGTGTSTITCPYSRRAFNINRSNVLQTFNKMMRLQNIKVFNIFVTKTGNRRCDLRDTILNYCAGLDVDSTLIEKVNALQTENDAIAVEELLGYNIFYAITCNPKEDKRKSKNTKAILEKTLKEVKAFSVLGEHLNTTVCQDFS